MQVAARAMATAKTEVSDDGLALVVHRFDVDEHGQVHLSPACDMLTTSVFTGFQHNPPGIEFMGKQVREAMAQHDGFNDIGKRMLMAWSDRGQGLRDKRISDLALAAFGNKEATLNLAGFALMGPGEVLGDFA